MEPDALTIRLRARNAWESMDMGVHLTRQLLPLLWRPWLIGLCLITLLITPLLGSPWPYLAFILLWWIKPVYDCVLLFYFNHGVFGQCPSLRCLIKAIPTMTNLSLLELLTIRRLHYARTFILPVTQLEHLNSPSHKIRERALLTNIRAKTLTLTLLSTQTEIILFISLHIILYFILPGSAQNDDWLLYLINQQAVLTINIDIIIYIIVIAIIEPIYVAAGFMLYLNQRTLLEAWDIEVVFRKIASRINQSSKNALTTDRH